MLLGVRNMGREVKGMIKVKHKGNFNHIEKFFNRSKELKIMEKLDAVGREGVEALSAATPKDSGKTASSWSYEITKEGGRYKVNWDNSNLNKGVNIALILQLGHGTGGGGYVEGTDYINPAIKTLFENLAEDVWREVINL